MNVTLVRTTLALLLACGLGSQAMLAKARRHSPARVQALQQCRNTYLAASNAVRARGGPKGNARKRAMRAATRERNECVARAPR